MHAVHARVKYQENVLKEYKRHAENGTFPIRWKSLKGYPNMQSPEAQKRVDEACHRAECMVLEQRIQEIENNLAALKERYQSLLEQRQRHPPASKHREKEKSFCVTMTDSSRELDIFGDAQEEKEVDPVSPNDDDDDDEDNDDGDDDGDNEDDGDDDDDPRSELKQEVKDEMKAAMVEQEEEGASKDDNSLLPSARCKLRKLYLRRLKWYSRIKQNKIHRQVMHTARRLMNEDSMDREEALEAAVERRKFPLNRLLEKPLLDETDDDDDDDDDMKSRERRK
ncbi:hypothetical protein AWC38_SpisGene676 [Stylophora pistillata]|uniref:Uncharacterized protein n=1 Tax=Stylophora pistillata TaxID=50429 RepID=A0A2B4SYN3_STYPI|nr:hypothetical protein AWC38_SpisGene676 [Stylophora pistillata]